MSEICEFLKQGYENKKEFANFYCFLFSLLKSNSFSIENIQPLLQMRYLLKSLKKRTQKK